MRRLGITGFCAIALLSGCGETQQKVAVRGRPERPDITLPCPGMGVDTGEWKLTDNNKQQTFVFQTDGRCNLSNLQFNTPDPQYPPGFSNRVVDPSDKSISYTYDGRKIADPGYKFSYDNNYPQDGSGSGVVKN
jgi:hypothetical protein